MKILYVVTGAEFGGPSRHVLWLMEHFSKQGAQVGVVAAPEPRLMNAAETLGARVFPNPYFVRPIQLQNDLRALPPVFRAVQDFRPDLVSAHSTKAGLAARFCCAVLRKKPVIFTAHGWSFTEGTSQRRRYALVQAERLAARFTARIICVSKHDWKLGLAYRIARPDKLVLIHNGVDPRPFLHMNGTSPVHVSGPDKAPIITMVGRLVPQKDPLTFLKACLLLEGPYKALLVGDGELREQAENLIGKNPSLKSTVVLAGEREDVPEILGASDIFVLPSRWEGLPRAVIEAMMAGLPVVATRAGGTGEIVEHGVTGLLVPPGDPPALATSLQLLLDNTALRQQMAQAGRKKALKELALDTMLKSTHKVYEEALGYPVGQG